MDSKAYADIQGGDGLGSPPGACYLPSPCSSPFLPACYQALCKDGRKVKKITDMALDVVELLDQHQSNPHYLIFIIHTQKNNNRPLHISTIRVSFQLLAVEYKPICTYSVTFHSNYILLLFR